MSDRIELQRTLESILGSRNVYFQPPENLKLSYPCIVYNLSSIHTLNSDDMKYRVNKAYMITLIDKNPDSQFIDKLLELKLCRYDRHYVSDNLNHECFTIYW